MPCPLICKLELLFHLQQSAFCKMGQIYFAIFGLSLTEEISLSPERYPATSPLRPKSINGNRKGLEH